MLVEKKCLALQSFNPYSPMTAPHVPSCCAPQNQGDGALSTCPLWTGSIPGWEKAGKRRAEL